MFPYLTSSILFFTVFHMWRAWIILCVSFNAHCTLRTLVYICLESKYCSPYSFIVHLSYSSAQLFLEILSNKNVLRPIKWLIFLDCNVIFFFFFGFDNRPSYQDGFFRGKMLYLNKSVSSYIFSLKKKKN